VFEIESLQKEGALYTSTFRNCAQYKAISCQAGDYVCSIIIPKNTAPELDHFWAAFMQTVGTKMDLTPTV
jgi:4'-phosphopantetheinyl transferase